MSKMTPEEATQLLQQMNRLDDSQVQDICELIERQQRMIQKACGELIKIHCRDCSAEEVCDEVNPCSTQWLKWLEQEGEE